LNIRSRLWLASIGAALIVLALSSALLPPQSYKLTAVSDLVQCFLLGSGSLAFLPLARRARARMRLFWSLLGLGAAFWFFYQLLWTYYEVLLRRDVPVVFSGDVVLFLHIVPVMAALALRPHIAPDEYGTRLGRLDFLLLLVWWLYLYVLVVIPWQYVIADPTAYTRNLNTLYLGQQLALLVVLAMFWIGATGQWKRLYGNLFGAGLSYVVSSSLANWAIERNSYYTGSFYDVPLAFSMAWLTWIGLRGGVDETEQTKRTSTVYGVWIARCSMIAVFSLPLFAAWAITQTSVPAEIRSFRVGLTLVAAFVMGVTVFFRQHLLDRELTHMLNHSREAVDSLKRLQAQILQTEKLASIGQLVGGAAHELNNPITAMLGYSDLLLSTKLTPQQQPLAARIGQYVRRTKSLVASLISFARQTPAPKMALDLNTLARTAVKLTQPQWEPLKIEVRTQFDVNLPKVYGDSNQLLQVCLQLVGNCLYIMTERGSRLLTLSTSYVDGSSVLAITTESLGQSRLGEHHAAQDSEDGLGLSACQGIVQEHRGNILRVVGEGGAILLRVELPASEVPAGMRDATVPGLWQSRPFA
jgi:signal transduction histidine kinase